MYSMVANFSKIYSLYNYFYFKYLIYAKGYEKLSLPRNVKNGIFEIFILSDNGRKEVLKIPRRNDFNSFSFYWKIRRKKAFKDYCAILHCLKNIPYLQENIVTLIEVNKNGGYKSVYVEGYNLKAVRDHILYGESNEIEDSRLLRMVHQIKKLIENLEKYNDKFGHIPGDWPLHNLVYDNNKDTVVNVDLEGFYTFKEARLENNLDYVRNELSEVINLINEFSREKQISISKTLSVIKYTSTRNVDYRAQGFEAAYHSVRLKGEYFRGQRECESRLRKINYNFSGKYVLDLGCNIGGMLHALSDKIRFGVGIDFSPKCINAANLIKSVNKVSNLDFYNFDLEREDLNMIKNFLPSKKMDICFLLSVCMWINNWKEVVSFCSDIAENLLFEANGSKWQQKEQVDFLHSRYSNVILVDDLSLDDPLQKNRKLYLCKK